MQYSLPPGHCRLFQKPPRVDALLEGYLMVTQRQKLLAHSCSVPAGTEAGSWARPGWGLRLPLWDLTTE